MRVETLEGRWLLNGDAIRPLPIESLPESYTFLEFSPIEVAPLPESFELVESSPIESAPLPESDAFVEFSPIEVPDMPETVSWEALPQPEGDLAPVAEADLDNDIIEEQEQFLDDALPPGPSAGEPNSPPPTELPDPSVLANGAAPPKSQPNEMQGWIGDFGSWIDSLWVESHQDAHDRLNSPDVKILPQRDFGSTIGVLGSMHVVVNVADLPDGHLVGSTGAETCIGLIVRDSYKIYVFHFHNGSRVKSTLNSVLGNIGRSSAVLFGGNGARVSEQALEEVMDALSGYSSMNVEGYVDYHDHALWVDKTGNYFVHQAEVDTSNKD